MKKRLALSVIATTGVLGAVLSGPVLADSNHDSGPGYGYRPGWGHGDKNHDHTGPPGLKTAPGLQVAPGLNQASPGNDGNSTTQAGSSEGGSPPLTPPGLDKAGKSSNGPNGKAKGHNK